MLASASPRRAELLRQIGVAHRVLPADVVEFPEPGEAPAAYVVRIACEKAGAGLVRARPGEWVLAADTEVVVDGEIFGKPRDAAHAAFQLRRLSGREHLVLSAVALGASGTRIRTALSVSRVRFRALPDAEIMAYIASGEPFGKAGAYAIQGLGALLIEALDGSYSGVMGLPLCETGALLQAAGFSLFPGSSP